MDFYESVFSILPLLILVFFFVRLAAAARKKNRPKPLNTIEPVSEKVSADSKLTPAPLHLEPVKRVQAPLHSEPQALGALEQINNRKLHPEENSQSKISENRFEGFSELKKALIWSEILGKPKGLD